MSVYPVLCPECEAVLPHSTDLDLPDLIACTGCGLVREVKAELLAAVMAFAVQPPVQDMRFCPWCKETREVGHDCPAGAVGCTTRQPDETPCGCCLRCLSAMATDPRYRSTSDLDGGA